MVNSLVSAPVAGSIDQMGIGPQLSMLSPWPRWMAPANACMSHTLRAYSEATVKGFPSRSTAAVTSGGGEGVTGPAASPHAVSDATSAVPSSRLPAVQPAMTSAGVQGVGGAPGGVEEVGVVEVADPACGLAEVAVGGAVARNPRTAGIFLATQP